MKKTQLVLAMVITTLVMAASGCIREIEEYGDGLPPPEDNPAETGGNERIITNPDADTADTSGQTVDTGGQTEYPDLPKKGKLRFEAELWWLNERQERISGSEVYASGSETIRASTIGRDGYLEIVGVLHAAGLPDLTKPRIVWSIRDGNIPVTEGVIDMSVEQPSIYTWEATGTTRIPLTGTLATDGEFIVSVEARASVGGYSYALPAYRVGQDPTKYEILLSKSGPRWSLDFVHK